MKLAVLIPLIALAGCASQDYGSWLGEVGRLPSPRMQMAEQEAAVLTAEAIRLRADAEQLRVQIDGEPDRVKRMDRYVELKMVNDELAPIERRLTDAGRLSRSRTPG
ncbi:hypothetical protein [Caenimonas koreensis]|uniref:Uncharacterized protein n=1 Tax=Caenimonas koreensis DSM 17982 TaxID=1121255 RepID=A0A844B6A5_9BURK|nr:hypothetical protein [Caenimonas koreensis]MRD47189.1 hypothetical protein [Caenimonas koreensis DSM 17982]